MNDKIREFADDATEQGCYSDCCGADIVLGDLCSECKEHCEVVDPSEDYPDDGGEAWSGGIADNH